MKQDLILKLKSFLDKHPSLSGKPATDDEIIKAERILNVHFDKCYKEFIKKFGGAFAGIGIHAFNNGASVGNETVIELTKKNRELFAGLFPEINEYVIVSDDGSGNPIGIAPDGKVVLFDYDTEEKDVLSNSFESFIENNFVPW